MRKPTRPLAVLCLSLLLSLLILAACGTGERTELDPALTAQATDTESQSWPWDLSSQATDTPDVPTAELQIGDQDLTVSPFPVRAGIPFTVSANIHNTSLITASNVPLLVHISPIQERIGYSSFLHVMTVTLPASQTVPVDVPVDWNLSGGEHKLWLQVNRLPDAWLSSKRRSFGSIQPEHDGGNNTALLDLMVEPFDAYASDLCPGRVDLEIQASDIVPDPAGQRIMVRVHNVGNRAAYNIPVVVLGPDTSGISYSPAIPPCGGTANIPVYTDRPFAQGASLTVQINPQEWEGSLQEDDVQNNQVTVAAGLAPGVELPPDSAQTDYDFSLLAEDIQIPTMWVLQVTVHNLGNRSADRVPIRIENEAGRKLTDAIPLVQGQGLGVIAVPIGYLWTPGGVLTITVNPDDAPDAYPETNRDNNRATFVLP